MTKDEALKLALKFVEDTECGTADLEAAIKDALAQSEQEPVAWRTKVDHIMFTSKRKDVLPLGGDLEPLYITPPQRTWVGLTDEEIEVTEALKAPPVHPDFVDCDDWMEFARAIENKLKAKNT